MTINTLFKWICKKYGKGEIQPFMKYDRYVKEPIRLEHMLEAEQEINELYFNLKNTLTHKIVRTKKGSFARCINNTVGVYDVQVVKNSANSIIRGIIISVIIFSHVWIFKCGRLTNAKDNTMTGARAFKIMSEELLKDGINIHDYEEEDGIKYKEKIETYPIFNLVKQEFKNVHHIDLNQAWPSAVCRTMPEFEKTFSRLSKKVLNSALGFCQSKFCKYKLSKLPMIGINDTNKLIGEMTDKLVDQGFIIVGNNTDGIWYQDPTGKNRIYTDKNEGKGLHKWKHDYINVTFYAESDGQYYIIQNNGKIEYKLRGYYQYENIKPRDEWNTVDDFFKAIQSAVEVYWDDEHGLIVRYIGHESI